MGLMDEAIGEFQFAAKDQRLLVDCASMLGICFREKGMGSLAVKWYRRGLEAAATRESIARMVGRWLARLLVRVGQYHHTVSQGLPSAVSTMTRMLSPRGGGKRRGRAAQR